MKRLLLSVIFALGFHAIILSTDFSWLEFTPNPTLTSKSLSIMLSADKRHTHNAKADSHRMRQPTPKQDSARNKKREKQPKQNPALIKRTSQMIKPMPAASQKKVIQKTQLKKSLKALTRKKQTIKTIEAVHSASIDKRHFPLKAEAKIYSPLNSDTKPASLPISTDAALIKKNHDEPNGPSEPLTNTAGIVGAETKDFLTDSVNIKIARPLYEQNTSPRYPQRARRMGYQGLVMLKVLIDENGQVDDLKVMKSSGYPILDRTALSSVKKWLFVPGTKGGKKKKMWVKIPIRFQLD